MTGIFKGKYWKIQDTSWKDMQTYGKHREIWETYMSSRQIPLHLSSCCYGYPFGGGYLLSRVLWKSACSRSNMKPKPIPKQVRKWIEELFCWFQVLRQHFMFLSFCIYLHASSFMFLSFACIFLSICIHFLSCSFHVPFMFLSFVFISLHDPSCSFHFHSDLHSHPSSSFHLHAGSFHFALMSFHVLSKVMDMALWLGQRTECNKWLSLRLSLYIVRRKLPQNDTERERERERDEEIKKESERVGCQMIW